MYEQNLASLLYPTMVRRTAFVTYHERDKGEVEQFLATFGPSGQNIFIPKAVGLFGQGDFVDSSNPDYIMNRIRSEYLADSTVTIAMLGACTHSRRYVDWELKASLRQAAGSLPNGVMAIVLPSMGRAAIFPPRLNANWSAGHTNCYARAWVYPQSGQDLRTWIEDAHAARTARAHLISNAQEMMGYNAQCLVHGRVCNV